MEANNSETAVIAKEGAVECDSNQLVTMTHIVLAIKEDGTNDRDAGRAHPPQCAIRMDDGSCKIGAKPLAMM